MRPPRTACSASMECGGRRNAPSPPSEPEYGLRRLATCKACAQRLWGPLLFGDDGDREGHVDVGMQVQLHLVLAGGSDRTVRHANLAARHWVTRLDGGLVDVGGADRAEQLALGARFGLELELEVLELRGASLCGGELGVRLRLELGALRLELRDVGGGSHRCFAGRHEEVPGVARLDLDAIADLTEVRDLLQQHD